MSQSKLSTGCLAVLALAAAVHAEPAAAPIGDWPQVRGPQRDGRSGETGIFVAWNGGAPRLAWRRPIGQGFSGVSVSGGHLFTMDADAETEYALALDPETGEETWRTRVGELFTNQFGDGPRSTPTVDGETVYVLSSRGRLAALDAESGQSIWSLELTETFASQVPRFGYAASPLIEGDLLVIETGGSDGQALAGLDKRSGETRWTVLDGPAAYSSPVAAELAGVRQIVFFRRSEPQIVSLRPDGEVYWTAEGLDAVIHMPLLVPPDGIFASSTHDAVGFLLRVGTDGGEPVVEEAWRTPKMKNHFNTSVVVDGHIYGFDNAMFKCLDASTGEQKWAHRGFGKGSLIEADGHLIVLSDAGEVALVETRPEAYVEKGRFQGMTGKAWTAPTLAGGRLYLRDQDEIASFDLRSPAAPRSAAATRAPAVEDAHGGLPAIANLSVEEALDRYSTARGGLERWRAVEAIETRGVFTSYSIREPFTLVRTRDGRFRFDTVMNGGRTVFGSDAAGPWWIEPFFGLAWAKRPPAPLDAQLRREWSLEPPLLDASNKGHRVELAGRGEVDGRETLRLEVTLASGAAETWHLDPATWLEVAVDSKVLDFTQAREPLDQRTAFADFRKVDGIVIPHRVEKEYLSRHTVLEVEDVRIDPPLEDDRFLLPLSEGMEALRSLAGHWNLRIETRFGEERPWQSTDTTSTITPLWDGAVLEERFGAELPTGAVEVVRHRSWDRSRELYRFTHVDDDTSNLMVFEGRLEDGRLTVSNATTATAARRGATEILERQVTHDIGPEGFQVDWERSTDGGATWWTTTRYTYTRSDLQPFLDLGKTQGSW